MKWPDLLNERPDLLNDGFGFDRHAPAKLTEPLIHSGRNRSNAPRDEVGRTADRRQPIRRSRAQLILLVGYTPQIPAESGAYLPSSRRAKPGAERPLNKALKESWCTR